ncbi:MAG: hypothetical protein ACFHU9_11970 [Fluviicola sp.]
MKIVITALVSILGTLILSSFMAPEQNAPIPCSEISVAKNVLMDMADHEEDRAKKMVLFEVLYMLKEERPCSHAQNDAIDHAHSLITPILIPGGGRPPRLGPSGPSVGPGTHHEILPELFMLMQNDNFDFKGLEDLINYSKFKLGENISFDEFKTSGFQQQYLLEKVKNLDTGLNPNPEEINQLRESIGNNLKDLHEATEELQRQQLLPTKGNSINGYELKGVEKLKLKSPVFVESGNMN